jgi:glyoxylase-like metal-dependent hydrolase (beta-lactamase superfamily II)
MLPRQSKVTLGLLSSALQLSHTRRSLSNMRVIPVPVREDNYSYLVIDDTSGEAAAVDPYSTSKVKSTAEQLGVKIVAGLTTHHHNDHSGGNEVRFFSLTHRLI